MLAAPPWTAIEIPGLLDAFVKAKPPLEVTDYIGRIKVVGGERRELVVRVEQEEA